MKKYIFYLIIIIFLSACTVQRAYIVNSPNVNCFKYEKEKNIKIAFNGLSTNLQSNWALNNKFGLSGSLYGGFGYFESKRSYAGVEIGTIFYKYLSNRKYFETQIGYGLCNNQIETGWARDPLSAMGLHGSSYDCLSNTQYHKLYVQPSITFIKKKIAFGMALKINTVYFTNYYYSFDNTLDDGNDGYTTVRGIKGEASYNNKLGFVCEPVVNLKLRDVFFIQLVGAFSNNIHTGNSKEYIQGPPDLPRENYTFSNPQHTYFKINMGFEFKLGKGKKSLLPIERKVYNITKNKRR